MAKIVIESNSLNRPSSNLIQKVETSRNPNAEISVISHTKQAAEFEILYFIDNEKTNSIACFNVGQEAKKSLRLSEKKYSEKYED